MVNYRYKDRFSRDSVYKDLVIVNHAAVVTGVDSAPPSITGANYIITNSDIDGESFKLYENLCSQPNLAFGACEASKVTFTIYSKSIPTLTDEWIDIYLYFEGDSSTLFRIGTYLVNSDKLSADRTKRVITAFDSLREMLNLDITDWYHSFFSGTHGMATIKQMRDSLFDYYTQQEIVCSQENVTLPNDNFVIVKTLKEDIFGSTLLPAICELNGCFGHVDRSGVFRYIFLKDYTDSPDAVIPDSIRKGTTTYEDYRVPSICKLVIYDSNNNVLAKEAVSGRQVYKIHGNPLLNAKKPPEVVNLTKNIYSKLQYKRYTPCKVPAMGNLCIEVGDYIAVEGKDAKFKSYVLSRTFSGIQTMTDTYESKGSRKAPKEKGSGASSAGDYSSSEWTGSDIGGSGGSAGVVGTDLVELIRNFGFRLLDEPQDAVFAYDKNEQKVSISWRDPADLEGDEPAPVKWAGTVVVRKEDSPPIHIWDEGAEVLVDSTERNAYMEDPFVDSPVPANKRFYYGVFPYDDDGIVKHYRWTKVFAIDTYGADVKASRITSANAVGSSITFKYDLTAGQYKYRKLVYKAGSIPRNVEDGVAVDIAGTSERTIRDLEIEVTYYGTIFELANNGSIAQSNVAEATTIMPTSFDFGYTGTVQTFTVPKNGVYQLEVWGAQGGDLFSDWEMQALDDEGGVGGYSTGEINLVKGTKLYIGVGGKGSAGVIRYGTPGHATIERAGGWNGGGNGFDDYGATTAGGGATHIATSSGQLFQLENNKSSVLIVAGGGGGARGGRGTIATSAKGFAGGGIYGYAGSQSRDTRAGQSASDNFGNVHPFGRGQNGYPSTVTGDKYTYGGAGGGWYGGLSYGRTSWSSDTPGSSIRGSGSGYIGNPQLTNKCMYTTLTRTTYSGNVDEYGSMAESTKTLQAAGTSDSAVSKYAKKGPGHARIKYLGG